MVVMIYINTHISGFINAIECTLSVNVKVVFVSNRLDIL